jgi:DNA-directed RNA polymerase subunit RPC12/RpoP
VSSARILYCGQCGRKMKPLFNVGYFCPADCDRKTTPDDFDDEEDTKLLCPRCSSSNVSVIQPGFLGPGLMGCDDCNHRWWVP